MPGRRRRACRGPTVGSSLRIFFRFAPSWASKRATKAVEINQDTKADLEFLRGRSSDLDGMRPKCTVIDTDGTLCLAKFPSVGGTRSITQAEALALGFAKNV